MESLEQKKNIPEKIHVESGLSDDYLNEVTAWSMIGPVNESLGIDADFVAETAFQEAYEAVDRGYLIRAYEERYPPNIYRDVMTEKSAPAREKLNQIAGALRKEFRSSIVPILDAHPDSETDINELSAEERNKLVEFADKMRKGALSIRNVIDGLE